MDLMYPFWVWLWIVIGTSVMSLVGTWIVVRKSRLLK